MRQGRATVGKLNDVAVGKGGEPKDGRRLRPDLFCRRKIYIFFRGGGVRYERGRET